MKSDSVTGAGLTVIQAAVLRQIPRLNLPAHAHVLDAPCGPPAALTLALQAKGFTVVGADLDENATSVLRESFTRLKAGLEQAGKRTYTRGVQVGWN